MISDYLTLANLACRTAIDIDFYTQGKKTDFLSLYQFRDDFQKEKIPSTAQSTLDFNSDLGYHLCLWEALRATSSKKLSTISDLALEEHLLSLELSQVQTLSKERLNILKKFFIILSDKFSANQESFRYFLVA